MKITRNKRSVTIICTDQEFEILGIAVDQLEAGDPFEVLGNRHQRRLWNIRTKEGPFLRVDKDLRDAPLSHAMQQSVAAMHTRRGLCPGEMMDGARSELESKTT